MNSGNALFKGVSAVIIGRDEARNLPRCLSVLDSCVDEVIYVDTGSRDESVSIAEEYGCSVFSVPWEDDFSLPKNHGLEQARYRWILNVDCDEVLLDPRQARERILRVDALSDGAWVPACVIWIDNLHKDGQVSPFQAMRLFRNHPEIRFSNPVHEGVSDSVYRGWPRIVPPLLEVRLRHYGYQSGHNREKIKRNIAILRRWTDRQPGHVYACYKLGTNLRHLGSHSEGLFFLRRAFAQLSEATDKGSYPYLNDLVTVYCTALMEAGKQDEAKKMIEEVKAW